VLLLCSWTLLAGFSSGGGVSVSFFLLNLRLRDFFLVSDELEWFSGSSVCMVSSL
jgi:hypothetical protein